MWLSAVLVAISSLRAASLACRRPRSAAGPRFRAASARPGAPAMSRRAGWPAQASTASTASGQSFPSLTARAQLCGRGRVARRGPVGPRFARGLERFGRRKDAGGGRKIRAARVAIVAAAVEPLVMALHQRGDGLAVAAQRRQRALAVVRMQPRRVGLAFGQARRLASRSRPEPSARRCRACRPPSGRRECRPPEGPCACAAASASDATAREWPNVNGIRMSIMSAIAR